MGQSVDPSGLSTSVLNKVVSGTKKSRFQPVARKACKHGDVLISESWNPINNKWDMQWVCRSPFGPPVACVDPEHQFLSRQERINNTYERAVSVLDEMEKAAQKVIG